MVSAAQVMKQELRGLWGTGHSVGGRPPGSSPERFQTQTSRYRKPEVNKNL